MTNKRTHDEIIDELTRMCEQVASPLGLKVVDVRMSQAGRRKSLQVTIFAPTHAVGLSDCETVSRQLEKLLDERADSSPLVEGSYVLEVQSPGIERELSSQREFKIFAGHRVFVRAKEKIGDLGNEIVGVLIAVNGDKLTIGDAIKAGGVKKVKGAHKSKTKSGGTDGGGEKDERSSAAGAGPTEVTIDLNRLSLVKLVPVENQ